MNRIGDERMTADPIGRATWQSNETAPEIMKLPICIDQKNCSLLI